MPRIPSSRQAGAFIDKLGVAIDRARLGKTSRSLRLRLDDVSLPFRRPSVTRSRPWWCLPHVEVVPVSRDARRDPNTSVLDAVIEWARDIAVVKRFMHEFPPNVTNVVWALKNIPCDAYAGVVREMLTYPSVYTHVWTEEGENVIAPFVACGRPEARNSSGTRQATPS